MHQAGPLWLVLALLWPMWPMAWAQQPQRPALAAWSELLQLAGADPANLALCNFAANDICHRLQLADADPATLAPDPTSLANSATRAQQLPLFRSVMAQPLQATCRAGRLADAVYAAQHAPHTLVSLVGAVAGLHLERSVDTALAPWLARLRASADPLAAGLAWLAPLAAPGSAWPPTLPTLAQLPAALRFELGLLLAVIGQSHQFWERALAQAPPALTPALLRRQALDGVLPAPDEPDFRLALALLDRQSLQAGLLDLVAASGRLKDFVSRTDRLPAVDWTLNTPLGQIVVNTTGQNNQHRLSGPLLVLDVGGDDHYEFLPRSDGQRLSVLLDHLGNDDYRTQAAGADPSSATLGYGILWDTTGDDHYQGTQQAQASALFGAALLVDQDGDNRYLAASHAQAHALGGLALLLGSAGQSQFSAQTHAQGSAGPLGVALLLEPAGDDRYTLDNTPLLRPSPQLPDHNTSMGQGAGRGFRAAAPDGRASAGGIGMLVDFAGNDQYSAQVFAQGAGYQEGLGLLVDDGGHDQFAGAWYVMGAAAHHGAGILLKRGSGHDQYRASHSTAIGAAHDFSVGIFLDAAGDDRYALGDLGLGGAHDNSLALFLDSAGDDQYQVSAPACRAFGAAQLGDRGDGRENLPNVGLFIDAGGADRYPSECAGVRNNARWAQPRVWPQQPLRSQNGAGWDHGAATAPAAALCIESRRSGHRACRSFYAKTGCNPHE